METLPPATVQIFREIPSSKEDSKDARLFRQNVWSNVISWPNRILNKFTVEILVFLFGLGYFMPNAFVQNLIIEKLCAEKYSAASCAQGVINSTIEVEIQHGAAQILLIHYLVRQIPSCILGMFMGTWSDIYGRKYMIIIPIVGFALTLTLYLLNYIYFDWPASYIIFASIPAGLTGDYGGFFMGIPGYVMDHFSTESITMKLSMVDGMEAISSQFGPLIGGQMFSHFGYLAVFVTCIILHVIAAIFAYYKISDASHKRANWKIMLRDFFRVKAIAESFKPIVKKRRNNRRAHILALFCVAILSNFAYFEFVGSEKKLMNNFEKQYHCIGHLEIIFLYVRLRYHWDVVLFSYYTMASGVCQATGTFILLPILLRAFGIKDLMVGIIGFQGLAVFMFSTAFVNDTAGIFAVTIFFIITQMAHVIQRACLSKWMTKSDIGKAMSIFVIQQAVGKNVGQILATQIYVATTTTFPNAFHVTAGCFAVIDVFIYGWIFLDDKRRQNGDVKEDSTDFSDTKTESSR